MRKLTSTRRTVLKSGAALAGATLAGGGAALAQAPAITGGSESRFPSADAPGSTDGGYNILFILTDQEQYMGYEWPMPLPGRERLRRTGTFFENHHIAADMCSASRAVIYTGLHQPHNGIFDNAGVPYMKSLNAKLPTVGKVLRKIGYYPAYKGKFHLNTAMAMENHPNDIKALFESVMDRDYGFFDYTGSGDFIDGARGGYEYDELTSAQAMQWLKAKGRSMADRRQPWYLAVNFVNPHDIMWFNTDDKGHPVQAKDALLAIDYAPDDTIYRKEWNEVPLQSTLHQSLDAPGRPQAHRLYHAANGYLTGLIPDSDARMRKHQNYYFNAIRDVDRQIVGLLDQLDRLGLTENTIIVFTADHGELLGSHGGLVSKGTTAYRQQNHVPLLVVHPGIPGGRRCRELTSHLDLLPTIVGMTGKSTTPVADVMTRMKGRDLTPLLRQPDNPQFSDARGGVLFCYSQLMVHDPGFTKFFYETVHNKSVPQRDKLSTIESFPIDWALRVAIRSITDGRYRFTRYFPFRGYNTPRTLDELKAKNDLELYDLKDDPDEVVNLAYDFDRNRELIATMNTKMNALIAAEIGVDDGSFLPFKDFVDWGKAGPASINI
ncbi:sulfatase-like hydrolase/transferase [Reyranella sp.]|uniref:sulfatase-like hydrolase/transferase n=1 Tax=Reyranella sp. TaxID=1929291 RepID=UPI003BAA5B50